MREGEVAVPNSECCVVTSGVNERVLPVPKKCERGAGNRASLGVPARWGDMAHGDWHRSSELLPPM